MSGGNGWITADDRIGLTRALERFGLFAPTAPGRRDLLTAAGVDRVSFSLEGPALVFASAVVAALPASREDVPADPPHPLWSFFRYILALGLGGFGFAPDDGPVVRRVFEALAPRPHLVRPGRAPAPRSRYPKLDETRTLTGVNLRTQMGCFAGHLKAEGVCAFTTGGDAVLLRDYLYQRLQQELKKERGRDLVPVEVPISPFDLSGGSLLDRLRRRSNLDELASGEPANTLLFVTNDGIPPSELKAVAEEFVGEVTKRFLSRVTGRSRVVVIVWANVGAGPLDIFPRIPPIELSPGEVISEFRLGLDQKVAPDDIADCLRRLEARLQGEQSSLAMYFALREAVKGLRTLKKVIAP